MTAEDIKQTTTMFDILPQFGLSANRSGMCSCPFHGKDKHPSMKIYKDGYKCFTCGKAGDIFKFVQEYQNCSFKEAFLFLGGTYEDTSEQKKNLIRKKFERQKEQKKLKDKMQTNFQEELLESIRILEEAKATFIPFSEKWCYAVDNIPFLMCAWEEKYIEGKEVNEINVHRKCREVRRKYNLG